MHRTVMAVFSGTDVDPQVLERAVGAARSQGARLVLLAVRHLQRAEQLSDYLSSETFMGRGSVEGLRRSVKAQRDHAIQRALGKAEAEARRAGLEVEVRQVKGSYLDSVKGEATRAGADLLVVEDRPESEGLEGPFEIVRV